MIRGNREYDQPTWLDINYPLFLNGERPVSFNRSLDCPAEGDYDVAQAIKHCLATLESGAGPDAKAVAYCWLFHLAGDIHQPMHSTALVSNILPTGDRGGNDLPFTRGRNLHALWDNLLGRQHRMQDVQRELVELKASRSDWGVDRGDVTQWIAEKGQFPVKMMYPAMHAKSLDKNT